jgi:hypothetical protein
MMMAVDDRALFAATSWADVDDALARRNTAEAAAARMRFMSVTLSNLTLIRNRRAIS